MQVRLSSSLPACGSEADNWAVKGTAFTKARQNKKHLITSAFEHHAIMHSMAALERMGFEVTYIKPTAEGYIRPRTWKLPSVPIPRWSAS